MNKIFKDIKEINYGIAIRNIARTKAIFVLGIAMSCLIENSALRITMLLFVLLMRTVTSEKLMTKYKFDRKWSNRYNPYRKTWNPHTKVYEEGLNYQRPDRFERFNRKCLNPNYHRDKYLRKRCVRKIQRNRKSEKFEKHQKSKGNKTSKSPHTWRKKGDNGKQTRQIPLKMSTGSACKIFEYYPVLESEKVLPERASNANVETKVENIEVRYLNTKETDYSSDKDSLPDLVDESSDEDSLPSLVDESSDEDSLPSLVDDSSDDDSDSEEWEYNYAAPRLLMMKSEEKNDKLSVLVGDPTAELIETWKMEISGLNYGKPLYEARPLIDEPSIRNLLPAAGQNLAIPIDQAIFEFATTAASKNAQPMFAYQKKKQEEYDVSNLKIWTMIRRACNSNQQVINYIKQEEKNTPNADKLKMNGASLLVYIQTNFVKENELHKDLIEIRIMNQKIKTNASDFIIEIERLIAEAIRLGSNMNPDEKLKTCLTKALMESEKYHSFYQTLIASSTATAATPIATIVRDLKTKINTFDINEKTIGENSSKKRKIYNLNETKEKGDYSKTQVNRNADKYCYKCGRKGHISRECYSKTKVKTEIERDNNKDKPRKSKAKTWKGKTKFQTKQYYNANRDEKNKSAKLKCNKCGGDHYSNACKNSVTNHEKIGKRNNNRDRNMIQIDEVSSQEGEPRNNYRNVQFERDPPEFIRSLVNTEIKLDNNDAFKSLDNRKDQGRESDDEYESDGPGSSSRVFSYSCIDEELRMQDEEYKKNLEEKSKTLKHKKSTKRPKLKMKHITKSKDKLKILSEGCTGNNCAYIDSGCSKTSLNNRKYFDLVQSINKVVQSASGKINVKYLGSVGPIDNVYWIPTLTDNLISVADLINLGITILITPDGLMKGSISTLDIFKIKMSNNVWSVNVNQLIAKLNRTFGVEIQNKSPKISKPKLFMLTRSNFSRGELKRKENFESVPSKNSKKGTLDEINDNNPTREITEKNSKKEENVCDLVDLLHRRMFHRGKTMIVRDYNSGQIKQNGALPTKLNIEKHIRNRVCNSCAQAKSKTLPRFAKETKISYTRIEKEETLENGTISTDLCGPYTIESWKSNYVGNQTFIMSDSKRAFIYGYKRKSDASDNLEKLISEEIKPRRIDLKRYHSDNARELQSMEIRKMLNQMGCRVTSTVAYSPKENSIIERHFRSEGEAVTASLLYARYIPQCFWYLCKKAYNYVYNLMPTNTSKGLMSPYQFDTGIIPNISHLRIWGCKAWAHIHKEKRAKNFKAKSYIGYLMGYSEIQRGAYIIFIPEMGKLIVSRDVKFDENIPQGEIDFKTNDYFHEIQLYNKVKDRTNREEEDFHYLIDNVYYDPDEDIQCNCLVTRITTKAARNIVAYFKRIINGIPEENEYDYIHVAEVEKMMGTYLEPEIDENVNSFIENSKENGGSMHKDRAGSPACVRIENSEDRIEDYNEILTSHAGHNQRVMSVTGILNESPGPVRQARGSSLRNGRVGADISAPNPKDDTKIPSSSRANEVRCDGDAHTGIDCEPMLPDNSAKANGWVSDGFLASFLDLENRQLVYNDVLASVLIMPKDPKSYGEAMASPESEQWKTAIEVEKDNLRRRGVLREVPRPPGRDIRPIGTKLVFKTKIKDNKIDKFKVRLVARGFTQRMWDDYNETFAPVARNNSMRIFLKVSVNKNHKRIAIDFTAAYLYGQLNEELYIEAPDGWECAPGNILKAERALYGTKQAGRSWYQLLKDYLLKYCNLIMCLSDNCIFYSKEYNLILLIYVDDAIISYESQRDYDELMAKLKRDFEIGEEGPLVWNLGVKFRDNGNSVFMDQSDYVKKLMIKYNINGTANTPMIANLAIAKDKEDVLDKDFNTNGKIGSLMYAAVSTRPDIMYAVSYIARFTNHPSKTVCNAITRIFQYLNGNPDLGINITRGSMNYYMHTDADLGGDINDGKSTSGGCEFIDGNIINWWSTKQTLMTAQSSCDSEVIAINHGCKNLIWTRGLINELGYKLDYPTVIYSDNESAIKLVYNPVFHKRTKHLRLKLGLISDAIEQEIGRVIYIKTLDNNADIMTKPQDLKRYLYNRNNLNMVCNT